MPKLTITDRAGKGNAVEGDAGLSIMEVIRENGFDELMAMCGGCCSCATCHVYIDPSFVSALPAMSEDENELLDSSEHRNDTSRLSCQVIMTDAIDGLCVTIAPED